MLVRRAQPGDERAIYDLVLYARQRVLRVKWGELRAALAAPPHQASDARPHPALHYDLLCGETETRLGGFWASTAGAGEIAHLIAELREEHRDLDEAIARLVTDPRVDQLRLTRMKKRKLKLKDWIAQLESELIPDIDA